MAGIVIWCCYLGVKKVVTRSGVVTEGTGVAYVPFAFFFFPVSRPPLSFDAPLAPCSSNESDWPRYLESGFIKKTRWKPTACVEPLMAFTSRQLPSLLLLRQAFSNVRWTDFFLTIYPCNMAKPGEKVSSKSRTDFSSTNRAVPSTI